MKSYFFKCDFHLASDAKKKKHNLDQTLKMDHQKKKKNPNLPLRAILLLHLIICIAALVISQAFLPDECVP